MAKSTAMRSVLCAFCLTGAGALAGCGGGHAALTQATAGVPPNQLVINGVPVPPDPGPTVDATLAGIDVNHNGVRDDVERAIAAKYGANKQEWAAVMQIARADQLSVVANGNPTLSNSANAAEMAAGWCEGEVFGAAAYERGVHPGAFSFAATNDTPQRLAAFEATAAINTPNIVVPFNASTCEWRVGRVQAPGTAQ